MKIKALIIGLITLVLGIGNLLAVELDVNYFDHGLVNLDGKVITTKETSYLTNEWKEFPESAKYDTKVTIDRSKAGERVNDYLFKVNTDGNIKVKDLKSGIEKTQKIPKGVDNVNGSVIYTVLQGYDNSFWTESYNTLVEVVNPLSWFSDSDEKEAGTPIYRLLVKNTSGHIDYYDLNVYGAFEKGEELKLSFKGAEETQRGKLISLIRVPALDSSKEATLFNNLDFAVGVYDPMTGFADVVEIRTFQFDLSNNKYSSDTHKYSCHPYITFDKNNKGYLRILDAVSATTRIKADGVYSLVIGFSCWDTLGKKGREFSGMRVLEYNIGCKDNIYSLQFSSNLKDITLFGMDSFWPGHYSTVATYIESTSSNKANQKVALVIPGMNERMDRLILVNISGGATFDWSEEILKKYKIEPKVAENFDHNAGEGMIVQGMILSVPPHPVKTEADKEIAYVTANQSFNDYSYEGSSETFGNETTVELGGIRKVPSMAVGGSYEWAGTTTKGEFKSITKGLTYTLEDYKYNMVIGIMPQWEFKSAVLYGNSGANVRYYNMENHNKPYVITSAVFKTGPGGSSVETRMSLTNEPGKGKSGKDIVLTKGMSKYSASNVEENSSLRNICNNLRDLAQSESINIINYSHGKITNQTKCEQYFNITEGKNFDYSTTNSWSSYMTIGMENVFSVSNKVYGSITKTSGTTTSDSKAWEFGFKNSSEADSVSMNTIIYQIPVKKLKAQFGERTEKNKLAFIPDYMWDKSMDYWLIAYDDFGAPHLQEGTNI